MSSKEFAKADEDDPVIIITGIVAETETACYELRRRGFLIESTVTVKGVLNISVKMSRKLMVKLAFETDIDVKLAYNFDVAQKQKIANQAVMLILRTKKVNAKAAWIAHNEALTKEIASTSGQQRLERINSYYGSKIALYFGWLDFYTQSLRAPAAAGVLLFFHQYMIGSVDSFWVPLYCIGICLWGTYFLEFWKRRCSELSFAWDVFECEDHETEKELATSVAKETSHKVVKQSFSLVVTASIIWVLVKIMLYYKDAQTRAHEIYGADSYSQYIPTIVYSLLPIVATLVFDPIAEKLNDYEAHTTQAEAENSLIMKKFALQFVNRYCALIYTAFWLKDMEKLKALLISLLTTGALINNAMELGLPLVSKLMGSRTKADEVPAPTGSGLSSLNAANSKALPYTSIKDTEAAKKAQVFLLNELSLTTYDLKEDYLEMVIQYGYVSMFAVVFPLAGLLAYINNYFEAKVDSTKLSECRRCPIELRSNIGSWQSCLEFVSFVSVLTNCYLMAMVSTQMHVIVPSEFHKFLNDENGRFLAMLLIEHLLVAIKVIMMSMIDDVPRWVREAVAVEKVESKATERDRKKFEFDRAAVTAQAHQQMMNHVDNVNNNLGDGASASHVMGHFTPPSTPNGAAATGAAPAAGARRVGFADFPLNTPQGLLAAPSPAVGVSGAAGAAATGAKAEAARDSKSLAISRLVSESQTGFGFDPINMVVLILLPLALQWLGISAWLYVPLAVLFFSYLQAQKDRADRKAAIGIVSDPTLMRLIHQELPSWITDSDFHRVEWLNNILKKLWPKVSLAVEDIVFAAVQPLLDKNTPPILTGLTLTKFHLGLISPKIIGIKVFDNEESSIRLDIELRWAGDPNIALKVGTVPLPMMVEVADLRFSATLRVELQDLKSQMPLFKALSITCMKKPFLDFSLKLASMDLMNIGASDYNISALVRNILHNVINDLMVYPAKLIIPMEKEGEEKKVIDADQPPVGILTITFERGVNLKQANIFGSDPYVLMKSSIFGEEHRTSIKYNTLNPEWNETFDFMIYDKENQKINLTVYDYDMTTLEKMLGKTVIETNPLPFNKQTNRVLRLTDTDRGELVVSMVYIPIASNKELAKQMEQEEIKDILFDIAKTDLTNELIISHETLQEEDDDRDFADRRGSFSDLSNATGFTTMRPGNLQRMKSMGGKLAATVEAVGVLNVSQIIVTGLKLNTFTSLRPFVNLSVGTKERKTKYQKGVVNPHFKESFSFIIKDPHSERLLVQVLDKSKFSNHKVLGKVELSIEDVMNVSGGVLEQKYMLDGEYQECYVSLKLQWLASANR